MSAKCDKHRYLISIAEGSSCIVNGIPLTLFAAAMLDVTDKHNLTVQYIQGITVIDYDK